MVNSTTKALLSIWVTMPIIKDTAGQEKYTSIVPIYYRDAAGAVIAYQITSK